MLKMVIILRALTVITLVLDDIREKQQISRNYQKKQTICRVKHDAKKFLPLIHEFAPLVASMGYPESFQKSDEVKPSTQLSLQLWTSSRLYPKTLGIRLDSSKDKHVRF